MPRFHRGKDPWGRDSYAIPTYAVVGSSDTGDEHGSPAPTEAVHKELNDFRKLLTSKAIVSRIEHTQSGNVFMTKCWVVVDEVDLKKALSLAKKYLKETKNQTYYIHEAT